MHPGFMTNEKGDAYCQIHQYFPPFEECESAIETQGALLRLYYPERVEEVMHDPTAFHEKGFVLQDRMADSSTSVEFVNMGVSPQKFENYQNALTYLETTVLQDPDFFEKTPEEIIATIQKTHEIATKNLDNHNGDSIPGKLRTRGLFVAEDTMQRTREGFLGALKKNGGTKKDIKTFEKFLDKIPQYKNVEEAMRHMTGKEKRVFKKIAFIPTDPEHIKEEMLQLGAQIKELGPLVKEKKVFPIAAGAYVHQKLGNIHPFDDSNGRVARLWQQTFLELGGYEGAVFPSDETYTAAVVQDQKTPGAFASFLAKTIAANRKLQLS